MVETSNMIFLVYNGIALVVSFFCKSSVISHCLFSLYLLHRLQEVTKLWVVHLHLHLPKFHLQLYHHQEFHHLLELQHNPRCFFCSISRCFSRYFITQCCRLNCWWNGCIDDSNCWCTTRCCSWFSSISSKPRAVMCTRSCAAFLLLYSVCIILLHLMSCSALIMLLQLGYL